MMSYNGHTKNNNFATFMTSSDTCTRARYQMFHNMKPEYYCRVSTVGEFTFITTSSFKAEGYAGSILIHRGCPVVIFRLEHCKHYNIN